MKNAECNTEHVPKYVEWTSPQCKDLLLKMVEKNPKNRPTAKECLMHPWFEQDMAVLQQLLDINNIVCAQDNLSN